MKKIILAVTLLTLTFSFSTAQKTAPPIKKVTAQTRASQPAGKAYFIDFTSKTPKGTIYEVAAGIDYSRVRVLTSRGEMALSDLAKGLGATGRKFLMGTLEDLSVVDFGFARDGILQPPGGGTSPVYVKCDGRDCGCTGKKDCKDLDKSGFCTKSEDGGLAGCGITAPSFNTPGRVANKYGCTCFSTHKT